MPEASLNLDWVQKTELIKSDWGQLATGESGDVEIERAWLRTAQELYHLFCKKQHDYGPTNIAVGGLDGVAIRVSDKVSRLWRLLGIGAYRGGDKGARLDPANTDESLRDTLLDLADYGIIAALVHDGAWKTMTLEEAWDVSN